MPEGTLEVLLVNAKGLEETDFLTKMDPYVVLTYRSQEKKSSIAAGKGSNPEWNETFLFSISSASSELKLKIMDSDNGLTADDFVGELSIPLEPLFHDGNIPPKSYNVVKDNAFCGEIRIGLTFHPQQSRDFDVADLGGWKHSRDY